MNASGGPNTCKSYGRRVAILSESGARVRNAYATYPLTGDSLEKFRLIPHKLIWRHLWIRKDLSLKDGHASD